MRTFDELEALWSAAPRPPRKQGSVRLLCVRREPGVHETPQEVQVSVESGLDGDRWSRAIDRIPDPESQVTLMNATVAELVAAGEQPLHEAGDNILVDYDISFDNLPAGSRLRIGEVVLEVSETPHSGCSKFSGRFGQDALRWVNWRHWRERRLRGVNTRVVSGGLVRVGDPVERVPA
ncbi:MAG TPA: MOSC domain-containing protein [Candidatus Limnocylindria bacterium]|jgi:MOSC domain-containing protein YiiM|nr:MOSC domain-containing protein [Candidatus Limnocylindria bacterium]